MSFIASFNISYDDERNLDSLCLCPHIISFLNIHSHIMCTSLYRMDLWRPLFHAMLQELKSATIMSTLHANINAFSIMNLFVQCPDYISFILTSFLSRTHLVSSKLIIQFCIRCDISRLSAIRTFYWGLFSRKRYSICSISGSFSGQERARRYFR